MSDDLVERLHDPASGTETTERNLMNKAADRIEELEAKLAEVVAVGVRVRDYFTHHSNNDVYALHDFYEAIRVPERTER